MAKISLTPQNFGTTYDVLPDIEGFIVTLLATDPLTTNHKNNLEGQKAISGFLILKKLGFSDVYINIIDAENFQFVRSVAVEITIGVY